MRAPAPHTARHAQKLLLGFVALTLAVWLSGLPWWAALVACVGFNMTTEVPPEVIKEINEARKK